MYVYMVGLVTGNIVVSRKLQTVNANKIEEEGKLLNYVNSRPKDMKVMPYHIKYLPYSILNINSSLTKFVMIKVVSSHLFVIFSDVKSDVWTNRK